ncbi:MAG: radical SAM protein [Candidatus Omnitrophica bacterium]|nr:radical SAM protein [Candidatus Omnitrophota bacterium]
MNLKYISGLVYNNFLFWLSHKINQPLLPPDMVQLNFTFRCNLSCKMCSMNAHMQLLQSQGKPVEIDTDVCRKIICQIKEIGSKNILFIGGEPFVRHDLFELVDESKKQGLNVIIVTNGVLLNEKNILRCFESKVDWLSISIDAANEDTFNKIRGKGVLEKIICNVNTLNKLKIQKHQSAPNIVSVCTIMDDNLEELSEIVELCRKINFSRIIFQPVVFNNADQSVRDSGASIIAPARVKVLDQSISKLIAFKKSSRQNYRYIANSIGQLTRIGQYLKGHLNNKPLSCYAGYNRLQITQDHVVYFCIPPTAGIKNSFGDVAKDDLKDLWYCREAKSRRKLIKQCRSPCMQWCSSRDNFIAFSDIFQEARLFGINKNK